MVVVFFNKLTSFLIVAFKSLKWIIVIGREFTAIMKRVKQVSDFVVIKIIDVVKRVTLDVFINLDTFRGIKVDVLIGNS